MSNRLNVELDSNRKIRDLNSGYRIKISPYESLEIEFGKYAYNFYSAAHTIASYLLETGDANIGELDSYFFSLAFLYRHAIELILKGIAFQNIIDTENRIQFAKNTYHDLEKILVETLRIRKTNRSGDEIEWLSTYLKNISDIDMKSDSFRYPFHIKRHRDTYINLVHFSIERIFKNILYIDLYKFVNKFEAVYEILSLWYDNNSCQAKEWKNLSPVFIEENGTYYGQSVVGYGYKKQEFYPYIAGYIETAGLLREKMIKSEDGKIEELSTAENSYFMPMCYLYRNAIELVIKSVWFEDVRDDYQICCKILYKNKHSIIGLWNKLREWIIDYYDENDDVIEYFDKISKCCGELQGFDSDASRFRYPCTKYMEPYQKQCITFDYLNLSEFMESLFDAIDGIGWELSGRNDYLNELESDM